MPKNTGLEIYEIKPVDEELKELTMLNLTPLGIYLQHCKIFAKRNFKKESLIVDDYKLLMRDLFDKIFKRSFDPNHPLQEQEILE